MLWRVLIEKLVGYFFILGILYIASNTIIEVSDDSKMNEVRERLRVDLKEDITQLEKRVIRVEIKQDDYSINQAERMDSLEETIRKYHSKPSDE